MPLQNLTGFPVADNTVPPATAAQAAGIPAAAVSQAYEIDAGMVVIAEPAHAVVDPVGDAKPALLVRGV